MRTKHAKQQSQSKSMSLRPDAQLNPLLKESWTNNLLANATGGGANSNGPSQNSNNGQAKNGSGGGSAASSASANSGSFSANPIVTTIITPSISKSIAGWSDDPGSLIHKGIIHKCRVKPN